MANAAAKAQGLQKPETQALVESWKSLALVCFCTGGLIGTMLTVLAAEKLGRRTMFAIYFALGARGRLPADFVDNLEHSDPFELAQLAHPLGIIVDRLANHLALGLGERRRRVRTIEEVAGRVGARGAGDSRGWGGRALA